MPFRRLECEPGAEAQVDLGNGAPVIPEGGKRRRTHAFRIILRHSREADSETVLPHIRLPAFQVPSPARLGQGIEASSCIVESLGHLTHTASLQSVVPTPLGCAECRCW